MTTLLHSGMTGAYRRQADGGGEEERYQADAEFTLTFAE